MHSAQDPTGCEGPKRSNCQSTVERLKTLAMEYKKLSDHSALTYEQLTESPELRALESQLQEVKYQAETDTGTVEAPISCGKNEEISRAADHPTTDSRYLEKSYGSNSETPTHTR
jgi:hypothetical protein